MMSSPRSHRLPCSNGKELRKIKVKKQNRDTNAVNVLKILGGDTETENGNIFLIALSNGDKLEYPAISFENISRFLLRYEGYVIFFYNLQYDAECILKLWPEESLKKYNITKELRFESDGFVARYIPKKRLTISKGRHSVSCYDIAQFYDNKPLVTAYSDHIREPLPQDYLDMKDKRNLFSVRYFLRHKKGIWRYCIIDCKLVEELALKWTETFQKQFGFMVGKWISSGYLAEKVLIYNNINIPYFNDIPYGVQELAWQAFYGGRFELLVKGFIGDCWLYDINSAYPFALSKIPDVTRGKWVDDKRIHPKAALGFYRIVTRVDDSVTVAPFPYRTENNMIMFPVGKFETYVTLEELKAVEGDDRISYKILESCQFIPDKNCSYPFKEFIEEQYNRRLELREKGDDLEHAIKVVLNSMYGKMAQRVNNWIGNLFSPVIASFITGYTRAQLYRFVRDNDLERHVVAFATDSIAVTKEVPNLNSKKLGEMKLDKQAGDVFFLSNGYYRFNGKWKQRGVGYDREKKVEIEHLGTWISDDDGQLFIKVKTTKTTHIKGGISANRIMDIGKIEEYQKKINLNSDKKRFWLDDLKSLKDKTCCYSAAWNANGIADILAKDSDMTWEDEQDETYEPESDS